MSTLITLVITMAISNEPLLPTTSQDTILMTLMIAYYHLMAVHNSWARVKAELRRKIKILNRNEKRSNILSYFSVT